MPRCACSEDEDSQASLQLRIKKSSPTTFGGFASRHPHIYRNNLHRRLSVSPDCLVESPALERVVNRNSQLLKIMLVSGSDNEIMDTGGGGNHAVL